MPAVHRSFYTNEAQGHRYWDFVSEELPGIVHEFLRVTDRPEETFVAGLSMGGYGALKLALTHPERYAAAASLSGGLDLRTLMLLPERADLLGRVFGGTVTDETTSSPCCSRRPAYLRCTWGAAPRTRCCPAPSASPTRRPLPALDVTLDLRPGIHEWAVWDPMIADVIAWLPLPRRGRAPVKKTRNKSADPALSAAIVPRFLRASPSRRISRCRPAPEKSDSRSRSCQASIRAGSWGRPRARSASRRIDNAPTRTSSLV